MNNFECKVDKDQEKYIYTPLNPYDPVVLQYSVLQGMGYPVNMEIVDSSNEELRANFIDNEHTQWELNTRERWVRLSSQRHMERYITDLSSPGDIVDWQPANDAEYNLLASHPVRLLDDIYFGNVYGLLRILERTEPDGYNPVISLRRGNFDSVDFLQRSIVTAAEQRSIAIQSGEPGVLGEDPADKARVDGLREQGARPLHSEQLSGLIEDYYRMVEEHFPVFRDLLIS